MGGCWQPRQQKGGNESVPEVKKQQKQRLNQDNKKEHVGETSSVPPGDSQGSRSAPTWSIVLCYSAWLDVVTLRRLAWSTLLPGCHRTDPITINRQVMSYIKNMLIVIVTFKSLCGASLKNVDVASCPVAGVDSVCCSVTQSCLTFL